MVVAFVNRRLTLVHPVAFGLKTCVTATTWMGHVQEHPRQRRPRHRVMEYFKVVLDAAEDFIVITSTIIARQTMVTVAIHI
jgi:hypothetical protein